MKNLRLSAAVPGGGAFAGDATPTSTDDVRSALGPREAPRTQVFQADKKAAYEAARAAVDEMGFNLSAAGRPRVSFRQ